MLNRLQESTQPVAVQETTFAVDMLGRNDLPANIQYFYDGGWRSTPPPPSTNNIPGDPNNKVRDGLGTTHHEAGTLWMGNGSGQLGHRPQRAFPPSAERLRDRPRGEQVSQLLGDGSRPAKG